MEYKNLQNLENKYPNTESYKSQGNLIALNGLYPETNKILFGKPSLKDIQPVEGTKFRFILKIEKDKNDKNPKFFTSAKYFKDLEQSLNENNPYFPLESVKTQFVVAYDTNSLIDRFLKLKPKEDEWGVVITRNSFFNNQQLDYIELVKYIDWVVDAPNRLEIDTGGVLPFEQLVEFTSSSLNTDTLTYNTTNTPAPTQSTLNANEIARLEKQLFDTSNIISEIEEQLKSGKYTNSNLFRTLGLIAFFPLSLLLLIGGRRRKEEAKTQLENKLKEYKDKRTELEKKIDELRKNPPVSNNQTSTNNNNTSGGTTFTPRGGRGPGNRPQR